MTDYTIEHWTSGQTSLEGVTGDAILVPVNNRAATRQAIITRLKQKGYTLLERSSWGAKPPDLSRIQPSHWDFRDVVIHHAGRSYQCAVNQNGAIAQMQKAQTYDMQERPDAFADFAYHYAVSCPGELIEGRDIRYTGSHVEGDNTGKLGIVLLENLAEAGEAWANEYRSKSPWGIFKGLPDILRDRYTKDHATPTQAQLDALSALIATLMEFFNITALGGHREYQLLSPNGEGRACPGKYGMQVVRAMRSKLKLNPP
jgi:N-acetylmuramoyl-L-alanine amidase